MCVEAVGGLMYAFGIYSSRLKGHFALSQKQLDYVSIAGTLGGNVGVQWGEPSFDRVRRVLRRVPADAQAVAVGGMSTAAAVAHPRGAPLLGEACPDCGAPGAPRVQRPAHAPRGPVPNSNLRFDFNVSVRDSFDECSSAVLRELDESDRFVQNSAESTSM